MKGIVIRGIAVITYACVRACEHAYVSMRARARVCLYVFFRLSNVYNEAKLISAKRAKPIIWEKIISKSSEG